MQIQSNDKIIIDRLANQSMEQGETTRELLNKVTKTTVIIRDSYNCYQKKNGQLVTAMEDL
jgi:hypothetical protein